MHHTVCFVLKHDFALSSVSLFNVPKHVYLPTSLCFFAQFCCSETLIFIFDFVYFVFMVELACG